MSGMEPHSNPNYQAIPLTGQVPGRAPVQNLEIESKRRGQAESDSPRQSEDAWVSWLHSDQAKLLEEGVPLRNRNLKGTIDGHHSSLVESDLHSSPDQLFFGDPHFRSRDVFDSLPPVTLDFSDNTVDIVTPGDGLVKRMFKKLFRKPIKPSDQKRILSLEGFHGCFKPGDCVALMGSSGAGKTTLLNVLSGRITKNVGGRVDFNGRTLPPQVSKALSCFVQQDVMFFGALTVQEHLSFQAAVRLPPFVSKRERQEIVRSMLDKVGLTKCRDSRIGNVAQRQFNGISGGEQRRLSVATELLTHPCIIFADEPTSGL
ncbi:atp-binding cassette g family transporter abcg89, partial [Cystoisospora suis]